MANQETWLKLVKFLRTLGTIVACIIVAIVALGVIDLISQNFYPAGLETKNTELALAYVFNDQKYTELPDQVEFSIDRVHSIFRRGDSSYEELRTLLNNTERHDFYSHSESPLNKPAMNQGDLIIRTNGITSRFTIDPSSMDRDIYVIWLPKLNGHGKNIPIFTADRRIIDFIKSHGTK